MQGADQPGGVAVEVHLESVTGLAGESESEGARRWAASRPNLFNVAVSRAKHRLYVIGNHDSWAKLPCFDTLAKALPVRPLKTHIYQSRGSGSA